MKAFDIDFTLRPVGYVESLLTERDKAPKQGSEGAPDAWLAIDSAFASALDGLEVGETVILLTWLHLADRSVLRVHPRSDPNNTQKGVFATRSPDRPNPIGLHEVVIKKRAANRLLVGPLEAIDGTPVLDIKRVI